MSWLSERIKNFNRGFVLYEQAHTAYCANKENKLMQMALVLGGIKFGRVKSRPNFIKQTFLICHL